VFERRNGDLRYDAAMNREMSSIPRRVCAVVIGGCALGASATTASAYVDPGSGSLVLQLVLGGVASLAFLAKHYWQRLTAMFRPATSNSDGSSDSSSAPDSDLGER
jgi:hypothetical protein